MSRLLFVVLALAVCANAKLLRTNPREEAGVLNAGPSLPVKYIQGIEEAAEPEEDYFVPVYMPAKVDKPNPSVTEGFCKQMLQDVKDKKAPYFLEGKFTGESRHELVKQCGQRICTWGTEIAKASAPDCGENCPKGCNKPKDFITDMLEDETKLAAFIGSLLKQFPGANAVAEKPAAAHARFKGVTKEFCEHLLEQVKAKEAPYWVTNKETGVAEPTPETRSGIVHTCSQKVCGFMDQYKELTEVKNCNESALQKMANGRHLLPLLEKIVAVIQEQPTPEEPVNEETEEETGPEAEDLITANDPRDPDFDGGRDGATGMTGVEGVEDDAPVEEE